MCSAALAGFAKSQCLVIINYSAAYVSIIVSIDSTKTRGPIFSLSISRWEVHP